MEEKKRLTQEEVAEIVKNNKSQECNTVFDSIEQVFAKSKENDYSTEIDILAVLTKGAQKITSRLKQGDSLDGISLAGYKIVNGNVRAVLASSLDGHAISPDEVMTVDEAMKKAAELRAQR